MNIIKRLVLILILLIALMFVASCAKNTGQIAGTAEITAATASTSAEPTAGATTINETSADITAETLPPSTIGNAQDYNPVINPEDFTARIDNKYFPLVPGTTFIYDGTSENGNEHNEVMVTGDVKEILSVNCAVIQDTVWAEGILIEQTQDWYAQDKSGNVWYFGEDSKEFENGKVTSTAGSWEAGVNGAKPGIIMEASPLTGDIYRQEYLKGEAEDLAEIVSVKESASVKYGNFDNIIKTRDYTPLEPEIVENKYFAPGTGLVLITMEKGGTEQMELTEIKTGTPLTLATIPQTSQSGMKKPDGHILSYSMCSVCHKF